MNHSPAQLFIVPHNQTETYTQTLLKKELCTQDGCNTCMDCSLIERKQHHNVLWVAPETRYTLDILDGIFKRIEFALEENQNYFFVIEKADFLTPACANSLLKIVEEPPQGYRFMFVAQRLQQVLPTIRSRCVITSCVSETHQAPSGPLAQHFTQLKSDPQMFLKEISASTITEIESAELVNTFLEYWSTHYTQALINQQITQATLAKHMVHIFQEALLTPAMPGSTKIFWRNLFLKKERVQAYV